ncbi:hypothetical protein GIB67_037898 [Kingdonia uniflora]|uniref:Targeting protein for Xklp2 n=1 Tax=Kingdonia uniflora TaxID=39325 RepID=A0A7J7LHC2_9MAGN|nr:hypothetical protein GIB67_037898 [Kingdonia uniflora]
MAVEVSKTMFDETYEFSAPGYFDFFNGETEEEKQRAELWFDTALSYAPSPFMPKIKAARSIKIETLCDFNEAKGGSLSSSDNSATASHLADAFSAPEVDNSTRIEPEPIIVVTETRKEEETRISIGKEVSVIKPSCEDNNEKGSQEKLCVLAEKCSVIVDIEKTSEEITFPIASVVQDVEACTPNLHINYKKGMSLPPSSSKNQMTAKSIASLARNPSALKPKNQSQLSQSKCVKPTILSSALSAKKTVGGPDFTHENQAIKRQKLDDGKSRQILNIKPQILPHKSKPAVSGTATNFCSSNSKTSKEERKLYVRETPFVSTAEMIKRLQSGTRDKCSLSRVRQLIPPVEIHLSFNQNEESISTTQKRGKLTLTRPKEPAFETSSRVRSVKVKSSAEIEEEMMAKIPKFKARPVNKKILEASTLPALPRSTPHLPEFREFHLKTTERANQYAETSSVASASESTYQSSWNPHKLTEPKTPRLETLLRARPPKVKSTQEMVQEELKKIPTFKARPLNKKIFENKGGLGMFCNTKRHVTKPREFHFATDERISTSTKTVFNLFDKLSINSESRHDLQFPRITTPNPFHLHTEERGAEKERKFMVEVIQKQLEEERARIPKAAPYPYTTDYPVIPPKPESKEATRPEPFELESLVRHEEEMQREMEERQRIEKEEAQMRIFKAQPVLKEDPLPVPEKARRPLTLVEEFPLHVDHRAAERAEFDKKIKDKEVTYKRYREENESAKLMEEEKALKQLRRTMVPHARPVPKFDNPFHPRRSSKETTKPKSPNLRIVHRKERKLVAGSVTGALSAAAAQMR